MKKPHFVQKTLWVAVTAKSVTGYGETPKKALADAERKYARRKRVAKINLENRKFESEIAKCKAEMHRQVSVAEDCRNQYNELVEKFNNLRKRLLDEQVIKAPKGLNDSAAEGWLMMAMAYTGLQNPQSATEKMIELGFPAGDGIEQAIKTVGIYMATWVKKVGQLPAQAADKSTAPINAEVI